MNVNIHPWFHVYLLVIFYGVVMRKIYATQMFPLSIWVMGIEYRHGSLSLLGITACLKGPRQQLVNDPKSLMPLYDTEGKCMVALRGHSQKLPYHRASLYHPYCPIGYCSIVPIALSVCRPIALVI